MSLSSFAPIRTPSAAETLLRITGSATLAAGALLYGAATSQLATLAPGTGLLMLNGAGAPTITTAPTLTGLTISGAAGSVRAFTAILRGSTTAWLLAVRDATDDLRFRAYDDAGAAIDYPLTIARAAGGLVSIPRPVAIGTTALLGSELVRIAGGSAPGTPGATDVLAGAGVLRVGAATASTSTTSGALTVAGGLGVVGRINAGSYISATITDAGTTNLSTGMVLAHATSGTPAAGFGNQLLLDAQSTTTAGRSQAIISSSWVNATDASRKARIALQAYDTAAREIMRGEASGTAAMIGFLGAAAVVRQTVSADATDAATTQTLANSLRTALINLGLAA